MKKTIIKNCLRVAVVLAAIGLLAATQDISSLLEGIKKISILPLLGGILLFNVSICIIGLRWSRLLRTLDIHFPILASIKVTFVGMFYNNILLSNIGGDLLRGWYVTKYTDKRLEAAFSVVVDRLCGLATCLLMATVGFCFSKELFSGSTEQVAANDDGMSLVMKLAIVCGVVVVGSTVGFFVALKIGRLDNVLKNIKSHIERFWAAIVVYLRNPMSLVSAMFVTIVAQTITVLGIYIACSSLNVDVPMKVYFIVFPISWVMGALPVSPGGLGVLELGIVAMFAALPQVSSEQALTLALCQRIIFLASSLPGLVIHLSGTHLPKKG